MGQCGPYYVGRMMSGEAKVLEMQMAEQLNTVEHSLVVAEVELEKEMQP